VIYRGRNKVGRVWQHAETKQWHGMIGRTESTGATSGEAFRNVAARALGYDTPGQLDRYNAEVRGRNRAAAQAGRYAAQEMLRGNFEPFVNALKKMEGK
jgi:hypothetical protein